MMGGTLTVIGTSTNLLASDIWAQIGPTGEPFSLFEFTQLGVIVLAVGIVYLLTVGRYLTPARITAEGSPTDQFGMTDYLTDVVVHEDSDLVGSQVRELQRGDLDLDVFQIVRNGRPIVRGLPSERISAGDVLSVRASQETLEQVIEDEHLVLLPELRDAAADDDEPFPEGFERNTTRGTGYRQRPTQLRRRRRHRAGETRSRGRSRRVRRRALLRARHQRLGVLPRSLGVGRSRGRSRATRADQSNGRRTHRRSRRLILTPV